MAASTPQRPAATASQHLRLPKFEHGELGAIIWLLSDPMPWSTSAGNANFALGSSLTEAHKWLRNIGVVAISDSRPTQDQDLRTVAPNATPAAIRALSTFLAQMRLRDVRRDRARILPTLDGGISAYYLFGPLLPGGASSRYIAISAEADGVLVLTVRDRQREQVYVEEYAEDRLLDLATFVCGEIRNREPPPA